MLLSETRNLKKNNYTQNVRERIIATNDTLRNIISQEIKKYGTNADLNHIDVSNVTIMRFMFGNSEFNGDISNWNVSNVTDMSYMFENSNFNGDISKWLPMLQKNNVNITSLYYSFTNDELSDIEI